MKFLILGIVIGVLSLSANAFDFAGGEIEIPEGFEGPVTQNMGKGASAIAFRKPHDNSQIGTLLQLTIFDPGQEFPPMTDSELKEGLSHYLLEFIGGIKRARENYKQTEPEFVYISELLAAKILWEGTLQGMKLHGTMYCYIYDSKIISLHSQDLVEHQGKYMNKAVLAFESIKLER